MYKTRLNLTDSCEVAHKKIPGKPLVWQEYCLRRFIIF